MTLLPLIFSAQALIASAGIAKHSESVIYVNGSGDSLIPVRMEYEKTFPLCEPWPELPSGGKIEFALPKRDRRNDFFKNWNPDAKEVRRILSKYVVVEAKDWRNVSHVAGSDRTGFVEMRGGAKVRWILRPAGIGLLIYPDGGTVHLLACCPEKKLDRPCT